jgi:hypothetical protein
MTTLFIILMTIVNAMGLVMVKLGKAEIPGTFALIIGLGTMLGIIAGKLHGENLGFCVIAILEFLMATFLCRKDD